MQSIPSNRRSRESTGSARALSIHTRPTVPPLLSHLSPRVLLPAVRKWPPPLRSVCPATPPTCAVPPPYPAYPLRRLPHSTRTAPAAPTKTKIRQSACVLPPSTPTRAKAFPPPDVPCTCL